MTPSSHQFFAEAEQHRQVRSRPGFDVGAHGWKVIGLALEPCVESPERGQGFLARAVEHSAAFPCPLVAQLLVFGHGEKYRAANDNAQAHLHLLQPFDIDGGTR